jgi:alpha-aminoadipate carrier protein LysW
MQKMLVVAECPSCCAAVEFDTDVRAGEIVVCFECSGELEVMSTEPPTLALAPEVEEDWGE